MSDFHCLVRPSMNAFQCSSDSSYNSYDDDQQNKAPMKYSSAPSPLTSSDGDSESEDGMMEMETMRYSHRKSSSSSKKRSRSPSKEKRPEKISTTTKALAGLEALASAAVMTKDSPLSPMPSLDPQTPNSPLSSSSSPSPPSTAPLSPPPARLPTSQSSSTPSLSPLTGVCICSKCLPVDTLHPDVLIERLLLIHHRLPRTPKTDQLLASLQSLRYLPAEIKLKLPSIIKSFLANLASQYFGINKHSHTRGLSVNRPVAIPSPSILHKLPMSVASLSSTSPLVVS